ncbi:hypothetical protein HFU84_08535 [Acidithiobacillus sp. CV18-2]|nr:hypothetical protein [Acidithiobacillus sp. CV18-3]MBU2756938.1 hypothetical protein [Acidithiobacillus sp. BN09-2]MBU2777549.1 hypothetical protein [Acidithiobacillus sp. CV18-2]MBU2799649.1 hypothetical protein [Acidithiobacillus sp. VAN18-4]
MRNTKIRKLVWAIGMTGMGMVWGSAAWASVPPPVDTSVGGGVATYGNLVDGTGTIQQISGNGATSQNIQTMEDAINQNSYNIYEYGLKPLIIAEDAKSRAANKLYTQALMMHMNAMAKAKQEAKMRQFETQNAQMPPSMPCGSSTCTGETTVSKAVAGGSGVFGTSNSVSGSQALGSDIDENLTSHVGARQPLKTYAVQCTDFASAKEIAEGVCPDPTSVVPNKDILGTTLLSMPPVGHDEKNLTLDNKALNQLVANLVQAPPVSKRHKAYYKTLAGQAEEGKMFSIRSRVSLARTALAQIAAMDTQHKGFGTDFAKSLNKKLIVPTKLAPNASLMQALAWEDQATYGNRKWYQQIAKMSKSALAKERVILQAQQLQYQYIAFRERTNIEALLATLLAEQSDAIQKQVNKSIVDNGATGPAK